MGGITFLFGSAEADRAFAIDFMLLCFAAVGMVVTVRFVLKALVWFTSKAYNWRMASRVRRIWK